ncbi:MAG: hypothetical protein AAGL10_06190 [Pseudomonadota bacterium]
MKPKPIIWFDWLFWASMALTIISIGLGWSELQMEITGSDLESGAFLWVLGVSTIFLGLIVLNWFFVSHKASNSARWIYTFLTGFGVLMTPFGLFEMPLDEMILSLIISAISVVTIVLLFLPETNAWFRNGGGGSEQDIKVFE